MGDYTQEYFDLYSWPIKTRYSEVYWIMQDAIPLPANITSRFKNKTMAIVGYEVDQVREGPKGEESVPLTAAYNHHYEAWMRSSSTTDLVQVPAEGADIEHSHGARFVWKAK